MGWDWSGGYWMVGGQGGISQSLAWGNASWDLREGMEDRRVISYLKKWKYEARADKTETISMDIDGKFLPLMFLYILQYPASQQACFFFHFCPFFLSIFSFLVLSYFFLGYFFSF